MSNNDTSVQLITDTKETNTQSVGLLNIVFDPQLYIDVDIKDKDNLTDEEKKESCEKYIFFQQEAEKIYEIHTKDHVLYSASYNYAVDSILQKILFEIKNISFLFITVLICVIFNNKNTFDSIHFYNTFYNLVICMYDVLPLIYAQDYIENMVVLTELFQTTTRIRTPNGYYNYLVKYITPTVIKKQEYKLWDIINKMNKIIKFSGWDYSDLYKNMFFIQNHQSMFTGSVDILNYKLPTGCFLITKSIEVYRIVMIYFYNKDYILTKRNYGYTTYYDQVRTVHELLFDTSVTNCLDYLWKTKNIILYYISEYLITDLSKIIFDYIPVAVYIASFLYRLNIKDVDLLELRLLLEF